MSKVQNSTGIRVGDEGEGGWADTHQSGQRMYDPLVLAGHAPVAYHIICHLDSVRMNLMFLFRHLCVRPCQRTCRPGWAEVPLNRGLISTREPPSMCLMLSLLLNVESEEKQATKSSWPAMGHHSFEDQTSLYILVITLEMMTKIFSSLPLGNVQSVSLTDIARVLFVWRARLLMA